MTKSMPINALVDLLKAILPELEKMGTENPNIEVKSVGEFVLTLDNAASRTSRKHPELTKTLQMHISDLDDVINPRDT